MFRSLCFISPRSILTFSFPNEEGFEEAKGLGRRFVLQACFVSQAERLGAWQGDGYLLLCPIQVAGLGNVVLLVLTDS